MTSSSEHDDLLAQTRAIRRLAQRMVRDSHRAEDVAQEAMLSALERPPRRGWNRVAWLRGVVRNKARRLLRAERRRAQHESQLPLSPEVPSTADVAAKLEGA